MAKKIQFGGELLRAMELENGGLSLVTGSDFLVKNVSIGTGVAESGELDCGEGMRLVAYYLGTPLVSTTITYKTGHTSGSRQVLRKDSTVISDTVASSVSVSLDPGTFYPWRYVSFVAGTVQNGTVSTVGAILASI